MDSSEGGRGSCYRLFNSVPLQPAGSPVSQDSEDEPKVDARDPTIQTLRFDQPGKLPGCKHHPTRWGHPPVVKENVNAEPYRPIAGSLVKNYFALNAYPNVGL